MEAIVCGSNNSNTSDKNYLLFSKEGGMLWASARSIREERSKQRYALQDFSRIRVSLIKGKSGWRIGSSEALGNPFLNAQTRTERALVTFVVSELRRYVHGEVPLQSIFNDTSELLQAPSLFVDQSAIVQKVFSLRLLSDLGYIAHDPVWEGVVQAQTLQKALEVYSPDMGLRIAKAITEGATSSHL